MVRGFRGTVLRWAGATLVGVIVGAAGTTMHRAIVPWGIAVCLAFVVAAGVLVRAWIGTIGLVAYAVGWVAIVQAFSLTGPGGDVLIPAGQAIGYVWLVGGMLAIALAAFAPRRWFRDEPRTRPTEP
ncbi:DUF6113 family protein [Pengzhenrongella sp.]|jgi:hypothetical protein|uniref:DUF6113 family protein n=1 Tax=Pengzhenrongella sp. TaxID=2888820 RepID=UPI002F956983